MTRSAIACCSTPPAIGKCITPMVLPVCRIPSPGWSERLELDIGKLMCPVLRGGDNGNVGPLPDAQKCRDHARALCPDPAARVLLLRPLFRWL